MLPAQAHNTTQYTSTTAEQCSRVRINVYLLDRVMKSDWPVEQLFLIQDRQGSLIALMGFSVVTFAITHYLDISKFDWKVHGLARHVLQNALLSTYLDYDMHSRQELHSSTLIMAVARDAELLVERGFLTWISLTSAFGKLVSLFAFQSLMPVLFGKPVSVVCMMTALLLPILLMLFLSFRRKTVDECLREASSRETTLVQHVQETSTNYHLIADFHRRPLAIDVLDDLIAANNKAQTDKAKVYMNNSYCAPWLALVASGIYTVVGGLQVLDGAISFGMFVSNSHSIAASGAAGKEICNILIEMQMSLTALRRMITYLNLPTDLRKRRSLATFRLKKTSEVRNAAERHNARNTARVFDDMPIRLENLWFHYPGNIPRKLGFISFPQGRLITIVGPRGHGKATVLKALSGRVLPLLTDKDSVYFVPAHLRVLFVPATTLLFRGSLYDNLIYGVSNNATDGDIERCKRITRRLALPDTFLLDDVSRPWGEVLSLTQGRLISLARAFIANPEVLCLDRPTESLNDSDAMRVVDLMGEFVEKKGVNVDSATINWRRPRTCIYTATRGIAIAKADVVFHMSSDCGCQQIDKDKVRPEMLM
eukprot:TRINITY_DN23008_c0_g1_i2.p1 TRINITY_DN23008_c0_g1~~TRINITY_DN23008_c0_g1_i2.p1  ORF type:complete len:595 (+),score=101.57 TRINITY_DN23008_c0_g1_i2:144-1928(+)